MQQRPTVQPEGVARAPETTADIALHIERKKRVKRTNKDDKPAKALFPKQLRALRGPSARSRALG